MNSTQLENDSPTNKITHQVHQEIPSISITIDDILEDIDNFKLLEQNHKGVTLYDITINPFLHRLTINTMKQLIDYSIKIPIDDSFSIGFKYPYNATELICSSNACIQKLLVHEEEEEDQCQIENQSHDNIEEKSDVHKRKRYDIIDHFFTFFNQNIDHQFTVLIGYFNKIFQTLLDLLGDKLIVYLFNDTPEVINHLIAYMHFRGIADCLEKMMTYSSNETQSQKSSLLYQLKLYQMILKEMFIKQNEEQIETICEIMQYSLINSSIYSVMIASKESIETLFSLFKASISHVSNYRNILSLLINLINQSKKLFSKQIASIKPKEFNPAKPLWENEESNNSEVTIDHLEPLIDQINDTIIDVTTRLSSLSSCYQMKGLGMTKIIESEYIKSVIELILTSMANSSYENKGIHLIQKLIYQKAFLVLTNYYFEYPNNSIFTSVYRELLAIIISEWSPSYLIKHIILDSDLISKTIKTTINEKKKQFARTKKRYTNNCVFANGICVLDLISKSISNNSNSNGTLVSLLNENKDYLAFNDIFMSNIIRIFNQQLCVNKDPTLFDYFNTKKTDLSLINLKWISLEELFEVNLMIYSAYKHGDDYKKMITILMKEMAIEEDSKNSYCVSEYLADDSERLFDSNPFPFDESLESSLQSLDQDDSRYYDNSYWQRSRSSQLDDSSLSDISDPL